MFLTVVKSGIDLEPDKQISFSLAGKNGIRALVLRIASRVKDLISPMLALMPLKPHLLLIFLLFLAHSPSSVWVPPLASAVG